MYEKVLVVGITLQRPKGDAGRSSGAIRVHTYNEDGVYRSWAAFIGERTNLGFMIPDTTQYLINAVAGSPPEYEQMYRCVVSGDFEGAADAESRLMSPSVRLADSLVGTTDATQEQMADRLRDAVIGHIVRVDWEQRGRFGRLAPHPLAVLHSEDDGATSFGGKPLAEWMKSYEERRFTKDWQRERDMALGAQLAKADKATETSASNREPYHF